MRVQFQYELLEVEEGLLVGGALPDLHNTFPVVLGFDPLTVIAYLVDDLELDDGGLLEKGTAHVLLHGNFDLESLGMRLGPHEAGVHQMQLVEALDTLQTQTEQLAGLECRLDP